MTNLNNLHRATLISRLNSLSDLLEESLAPPWELEKAIFNHRDSSIQLIVSLGKRQKFSILIEELK